MDTTCNEITRGGLSRDKFELRIDQIEMEFLRAAKSARTIDMINATAREIAMQRNMNMMVEDLIVQLEMETNITVAVSRIERVGHIPFPPQMNKQQTMINFDNNR